MDRAWNPLPPRRRRIQIRLSGILSRPARPMRASVAIEQTCSALLATADVDVATWTKTLGPLALVWKHGELTGTPARKYEINLKHDKDIAAILHAHPA